MNKKIIKIETPRLFLEPLDLNHAEVMFKFYSDELIYEYLESDVPESIEWLREQFRLIQRREIISKKGELLKLYDWVAIDKESGKVVGKTDFTIYPNGNCNVGYMISSEFWNKGMASEIVRAGLDYMKGNDNILYFTISCDTRNIASNRIAHKFNFKLKRIDVGVNQLKNRIGDDNVYILTNGI